MENVESRVGKRRLEVGPVCARLGRTQRCDLELALRPTARFETNSHPTVSLSEFLRPLRLDVSAAEDGRSPGKALLTSTFNIQHSTFGPTTPDVVAYKRNPDSPTPDVVAYKRSPDSPTPDVVAYKRSPDSPTPDVVAYKRVFKFVSIRILAAATLGRFCGRGRPHSGGGTPDVVPYKRNPDALARIRLRFASARRAERHALPKTAL
jgi:hypothetical protein